MISVDIASPKKNEVRMSHAATEQESQVQRHGTDYHLTGASHRWGVRESKISAEESSSFLVFSLS